MREIKHYYSLCHLNRRPDIHQNEPFFMSRCNSDMIDIVLVGTVYMLANPLLLLLDNPTFYSKEHSSMNENNSHDALWLRYVASQSSSKSYAA